jgi:hypothetical protein
MREALALAELSDVSTEPDPGDMPQRRAQREPVPADRAFRDPSQELPRYRQIQYAYGMRGACLAVTNIVLGASEC